MKTKIPRDNEKDRSLTKKHKTFSWNISLSRDYNSYMVDKAESTPAPDTFDNAACFFLTVKPTIYHENVAFRKHSTVNILKT